MAENRDIIFICNTYMQLITAIQMKTAMFSDRRADLVLSDHSVNAANVCENTRKLQIFDHVHFVRSRELEYNYSAISDLAHRFKLLLGDNGFFEPAIEWKAGYKVIFAFNSCDQIVQYIYSMSARKGTTPELKCYEEGILSCFAMFDNICGRRDKLFEHICRLFGIKCPYGNVKEYYCYYPELYPSATDKVYPIPLISRDRDSITDLLNGAFSYDPDRDVYPQKYIFFGTALDIDGFDVGEADLVLRIADLVGKDNLLVKLHPRDRRGIYEEYGIAVSRSSSIPWEVIQINRDFSDHVFLSVNSGSVLNASAMLGDDIPTFYLYPLVRGKNDYVDRFGDNAGGVVSSLQESGALKRMRIVESLDEIMSV